MFSGVCSDAEALALPPDRLAESLELARDRVVDRLARRLEVFTERLADLLEGESLYQFFATPPHLAGSLGAVVPGANRPALRGPSRRVRRAVSLRPTAHQQREAGSRGGAERQRDEQIVLLARVGGISAPAGA